MWEAAKDATWIPATYVGDSDGVLGPVPAVVAMWGSELVDGSSLSLSLSFQINVFKTWKTITNTNHICHSIICSRRTKWPLYSHQKSSERGCWVPRSCDWLRHWDWVRSSCCGVVCVCRQSLTLEWTRLLSCGSWALGVGITAMRGRWDMTMFHVLYTI